MAFLNFDSRVNYQKIFAQGSYTVSVANPNFDSTNSISHSLGYVPNCRVWFTNGNGDICSALPLGFSFANFTAFSGYSCYYKITTSGLTIVFDRGFNVGPTSSTTIYYRIYLDAIA